MEPLLWDTSIQGSLPVRGCKIWSRGNIRIIFLSVTSDKETPLFRGEGHFFWVLNPRFYLHSGDTLVLRTWLTTKRIDKVQVYTMIAAFTTWTMIISLRERVQISASGHTDDDQLGTGFFWFHWMSDLILSVPNEMK